MDHLGVPITGAVWSWGWPCSCPWDKGSSGSAHMGTEMGKALSCPILLDTRGCFAHSSHLSSTPSCSMKAAKCFFSSLSVSSHVGLARTRQLLRDAAFRRRCSLLIFWELRNRPVETQPSAPGSQCFPPQ